MPILLSDTFENSSREPHKIFLEDVKLAMTNQLILDFNESRNNRATQNNLSQLMRSFVVTKKLCIFKNPDLILKLVKISKISALIFTSVCI